MGLKDVERFVLIDRVLDQYVEHPRWSKAARTDLGGLHQRFEAAQAELVARRRRYDQESLSPFVPSRSNPLLVAFRNDLAMLEDYPEVKPADLALGWLENWGNAPMFRTATPEHSEQALRVIALFASNAVMTPTVDNGSTVRL